MKNMFNHRCKPLLYLLSIGLGLGLLITLLTWVYPTVVKSLFGNAAWPWWGLTLGGAFLLLTGVRLVSMRFEQPYPAISKPARLSLSKPALLLAVLAATALVYLFPELFAPGCKGMPRVFAACPPECRVTTCTDWDAPGENGCDAKPPNKGCCRSYETTCAPDCGDPGDPDPTPTPSYQPPSISGTLNCAAPGLNEWCRYGAGINLSASDPQNFPTLISGEIAGQNFSCAGPECFQVLPAGKGTSHFQATASTSRLSSGVGSVSFAYDPTPPSAEVVISGTQGKNGWYTSAAVSATGSDSISGLASAQVGVDGTAWQPTVTLSEGVHTIVARTSDKAGNVDLTLDQVIKVDGTAPSLSVAVASGRLVAGWYVTEVQVAATVNDATSGVALTEYNLDSTGWQLGANLTVTTDGPHKVDFRASDQAGNQSIASLKLQIDRTAPSSVFTSPAPNAYLRDQVILAGKSIDAASGLASVQISLDDGSTWTSLPVSPKGEWQFAWETSQLPNDEERLLVQAQDLAGNLESPMPLRVVLANHPPKVSIQDSWNVDEAGSLSVYKRFIPIGVIRLRIACLDGQPDVKLSFTPETLPETLKWDRKCGQGQFATSGDHLVTLTACDLLGNCESATGTIKVPFISLLPTQTPRPTLGATSTPTASSLRPTAQPRKTRPAATQTAVTVPTTQPSPPPSVKPATPSLWLWPPAALLGLWLVLGINAVSDPRPAALKRLRASLEKLALHSQEKPERF